jgi:hypothetical protein
MPYLPILDILKGYFEIEEGDREPAIKKKIRERLREAKTRLKRHSPRNPRILNQGGFDSCDRMDYF